MGKILTTTIQIDCVVGHFVSSPKEREKQIEEIVEMNERDREERGTGMKVKKQKK